MNICLVLGAGATYADRKKGRCRYEEPPLDRNFFWNHRLAYADADGRVRTRHGRFRVLDDFFLRNFGHLVTPKDDEHNSLEYVLRHLYNDLFVAASSTDSAEYLTGVVEVLNTLIARSTTRIIISHKLQLVQVLEDLVNSCGDPSGLTVVSFNYDLLAERALEYLSKNGHVPGLFSFPSCYRLPETSFDLTSPKRSHHEIFGNSDNSTGVMVLKPHGSLNWFTPLQKGETVLDLCMKPRSRILVSRRKKLSEALTYNKRATFPVIIPPFGHKASLIKNGIIDSVWAALWKSLEKAERVVCYGYSFPPADEEARHVFTRACRSSGRLQQLEIINPDIAAFSRTESALGAPKALYFRTAKEYMDHYSIPE